MDNTQTKVAASRQRSTEESNQLKELLQILNTEVLSLPLSALASVDRTQEASVPTLETQSSRALKVSRALASLHWQLPVPCVCGRLLQVLRLQMPRTQNR
jgi:hypothetical protein